MKQLLREKQIFEASLLCLYPILNWITERISKYFSQRDIEKIQLAAEEAIVNIIKHGYKKKKGKIELELFVDEYFTLAIKDKSPKFNPLSKRKKIFYPEKKPGGLGIFLIFQCVDEVHYKRKDSCNILTLKKKRHLDY